MFIFPSLNCCEGLAPYYKPAFYDLHKARKSSVAIPHNFTFQSNQLHGKSANLATLVAGMAHLHMPFFFFLFTLKFSF